MLKSTFLSSKFKVTSSILLTGHRILKKVPKVMHNLFTQLHFLSYSY